MSTCYISVKMNVLNLFLFWFTYLVIRILKNIVADCKQYYLKKRDGEIWAEEGDEPALFVR